MTGNLIGISGKLRSGKDTVADYLVQKYGWVKLGMSDPLNDALIKLDPLILVPDDSVVPRGYWRYQEIVTILEKHFPGDSYTQAKTIPEVRRLLQMLGTEIGRNMFGENVWVDLAADKIQRLRHEGKDVIITGIRFPNESLLIERLGGIRVLVERPGLANTDFSSHASEVSLDHDAVDLVIHNSSDLDHLYEAVDRLMVIHNA
jgi:hypothetical protein